MNLHPSIATFFEADRRSDSQALTHAFAPDAAVVDEGRTYIGREAIGAWWSKTKSQYQTILDPLEASDVGHATLVRTQVSGDFVGSPAILCFAFQLTGDAIEALEIGA